MIKNLVKFGATFSVAALMLTGCEHQDFININEDATRVSVNQISPEMAAVRDYVPPFAVMAHRGSTFWAPEETEAAWRWAREMGADYLESDLQCSKDGVILANHDDNLCRTTDIENVYGEYVPHTRKQFYIDHGCTPEEAEKLYKRDVASFRPYNASSYMYEELLALDAGSWFNESSMEQAREGFVDKQLYISSLEDQIRYAEGMRLKRDENGKRIYKITGKWDDSNCVGKFNHSLTYTFDYEKDPADTGNRPGIYIEFKESWLNPADFEERVYNELDRLGWNVITKPAKETAFYKNGKVNVGNTNGKVILQSFSLESLRRTAEKFQGKVPMCFLLWAGQGATDLKNVTPTGYADFINLALSYKAHIIGPCIAGAPNNYPELNAPWMAYLIKKSGMLNHPYSFDSYAQMGKYFGLYNWGNTVPFDDLLHGIYGDGAFTNRTELTLKYFIDNGLRSKDAAQTVREPVDVLEALGY